MCMCAAADEKAQQSPNPSFAIPRLSALARKEIEEVPSQSPDLIQALPTHLILFLGRSDVSKGSSYSYYIHRRFY